jgi:HlyD family secretion protein
MENKSKDIELKSVDFQDMLGKTPNWILRWGISLILFIIIIFIIGTSLFKYPDTISATFVLTGTTPPARIKARTFGLITKLYIEDNQKVSRGDYLAIIENSANDNDVKYIKGYLLNFSLKKDSIILELPNRELHLGELQSSFLSFYQVLYNYIEFKRNNYYEKKIETLKERIILNQKHYFDLKNQKDIIDKQFVLKNRQFIRDSLLYNKGIISEQNLEETKEQYFNGELSLSNSKTILNNVQISILETEELLLNIENEFIEKDNYYRVQVNGMVSQLLSEIQSWEINYVLQAPIDGEVSFNNYWSENQNIVSGEDVFNIIPSDDVKPIAKVFLPIARSGKVAIGQKVNLHFDNFPDSEFGVMRGIVNNISLLPSVDEKNSFYILEISLPNGLMTSYNKELPYYFEMKGNAEIITEDLSLLERILFPIRKLFTENINPTW